MIPYAAGLVTPFPHNSVYVENMCRFSVALVLSRGNCVPSIVVNFELAQPVKSTKY